MNKCEIVLLHSGAMCDLYKTACGIKYTEGHTDRYHRIPDYKYCPWCGKKLKTE